MEYFPLVESIPERLRSISPQSNLSVVSLCPGCSRQTITTFTLTGLSYSIIFILAFLFFLVTPALHLPVETSSNAPFYTARSPISAEFCISGLSWYKVSVHSTETIPENQKFSRNRGSCLVCHSSSQLR